ncbi:glutamate-cysteine ligase family protein [Psychroflexus montanilacus]|uniref:glutamate-cysteine ligase family protein n=1 Tax=Psychroflexus montanilacus TaxID=2873598 RepID=UPI001CCE1F14|nr:glutamate-cysteine ligase family protein [Psychroflexus montanilacus]MBZ9650439.1 glutamate--cysteine ligase [Psychroflexus montanilacus]
MKYHLFEVFGIELEYMLVNSKTGKIHASVDELMKLKTGQIVSDVDNGDIEWSNELAAHVVELKTNGPTKDLNTLDQKFHENIVEINHLLKAIGLSLWPTAAHPLMNPELEMKLWQHSYSDVYALYNRIFDCRGHGWSNVQSMHINLPFYDDVEFEKLHAAIRILLPILPGLSASSPILDGKSGAFMDSRMKLYLTNQKQIPEMTGKVIPEQVFSYEEYKAIIFEPINAAIAPYDHDQILEHHFLNSRGAIARFDRNAIEIRVLDLQECPLADVAIASFIVEILKDLVGETYSTLQEQKQWHEDSLFEILNQSIESAENAVIHNKAYLNLFGIDAESMSIKNIFKHLFEKVSSKLTADHASAIALILEHGSLSTRILKAIQNDFSERNILKVYQNIGVALSKNKLFLS